jgi:hypothetical protein
LCGGLTNGQSAGQRRDSGKSSRVSSHGRPESLVVSRIDQIQATL